MSLQRPGARARARLCTRIGSLHTHVGVHAYTQTRPHTAAETETRPHTDTQRAHTFTQTDMPACLGSECCATMTSLYDTRRFWRKLVQPGTRKVNFVFWLFLWTHLLYFIFFRATVLSGISWINLSYESAVVLDVYSIHSCCSVWLLSGLFVTELQQVMNLAVKTPVRVTIKWHGGSSGLSTLI